MNMERSAKARRMASAMRCTVSGLPNRSYEVRLYRTWQGRYLEPEIIEARDGKLTCTIPELNTARGHAQHIGHDVAFKIAPAK